MAKLYWTQGRHPWPTAAGRKGLPKYKFVVKSDGYRTCEVTDPKDFDYLRREYSCKTAEELGLVTPEVTVEPEKVTPKPKKKKAKK